jgi:transposase-like protein
VVAAVVRAVVDGVAGSAGRAGREEVCQMTLFKWLLQAEVDEGTKPGAGRTESAELCEARRRIKLREQENEALRRAAA